MSGRRRWLPWASGPTLRRLAAILAFQAAWMARFMPPCSGFAPKPRSWPPARRSSSWAAPAAPPPPVTRRHLCCLSASPRLQLSTCGAWDSAPGAGSKARQEMPRRQIAWQQQRPRGAAVAAAEAAAELASPCRCLTPKPYKAPWPLLLIGLSLWRSSLRRGQRLTRVWVVWRRRKFSSGLLLVTDSDAACLTSLLDCY